MIKTEGKSEVSDVSKPWAFEVRLSLDLSGISREDIGPVT